ncbi:unnamed protein product, partial [Sphacelaria rigidula]
WSYTCSQISQEPQLMLEPELEGYTSPIPAAVVEERKQHKIPLQHTSTLQQHVCQVKVDNKALVADVDEADKENAGATDMISGVDVEEERDSGADPPPNKKPDETNDTSEAPIHSQTQAVNIEFMTQITEDGGLHEDREEDPNKATYSVKKPQVI